MSNPVLIRGVLYPSQAAAARALGVYKSTIRCALEAGTLDNIGRGKSRPRPYTYAGETFASQAECARRYGVHTNTFNYRLKAGRDPITGQRPDPPTHEEN